MSYISTASFPSNGVNNSHYVCAFVPAFKPTGQPKVVTLELESHLLSWYQTGFLEGVYKDNELDDLNAAKLKQWHDGGPLIPSEFAGQRRWREIHELAIGHTPTHTLTKPKPLSEDEEAAYIRRSDFCSAPLDRSGK